MTTKLEELLAASDKATPGPWIHRANSHGGVESGGWHEIYDADRKLVYTLASPCASSGADDAETNARAELIVAARNSIPALRELISAMTWIPCSERMPELFTRVLMMLKSGIISTGHRGDSGPR